MKKRHLGLFAALGLAIGALAAQPASAAAMSTGPALKTLTAQTEAVTEVRDRRRHWRHRHHRWHRHHGWRHRGWRHRQHYYPRRHWRPAYHCWRHTRYWTPYGYVVRRVWVCR